MMTLPGQAYPRTFIALSKMLRNAVITPLVSETDTVSFKQFLFLNNTFRISLYFLLSFSRCSAYAVLLGGVSGFYRKRRAKSAKGTVIKMASNLRNEMTSYFVLCESKKKPGVTELNESESIVERADKKVTEVITSDRNQFIVTLLALFMTNKYPKPQRIEPSKQIQGFYSERVVLSQTPAIMATEAMQQLKRSPFFVRHQLIGAAKRAWEMGKTRQLRVMTISGVPNAFLTMVTMAAKLLLGIPLTREASRQTDMITNRQGLSSYWGSISDFCSYIVDNQQNLPPFN